MFAPGALGLNGAFPPYGLGTPIDVASVGMYAFGLGSAAENADDPPPSSSSARARDCVASRASSHRARLAHSASASSRASSVLPRAASAGDAPRSQVATSVFNVATEKLPGGDKLSNEGILAFVLAGFLAVWLGGTFIKTFAVMIGFLFTAAKYFAMGVALVLLGVAAS